MTNVYRLHLGLVVPPHCAMTVAGETRAWQDGGCLVFDDTSEHESWNRSASDRYVLLLDLLRPGCQSDGDERMPVAVRMRLGELLRAQRDRT